MAIQELAIQGFRSLYSVVWKPDRLNLIVGPNGSGKSNLIRFMQLVATVAGGGLRKELEARGGMVHLLWDYRPGRIGWRLRIDPVDPGRDLVRDALTFEFELGQIGGGSAYEIQRDTLGSWFKFEQGSERSPYWTFQRDARRAVFFDQNQQKLADFQPDEFDPNESLLSQISDVRNRVPSHARRTIGSWAIHHDIHVDRDAAMRRPATTQPTKRLEADGSNLATFLHTNYSDRTFKDLIDDGMRAGFGSEYDKLDFPPAAASQIELAVFWKSSAKAHVAQDLSDGTLRFLLMLAALANPDPPPLIVLDEPEIGLHPSMLPIISEYAVDASTRTQVVLSSHSPEFLDTFSKQSPNVTLCQWEDGQTNLSSLDPNRLAHWLKAYRLGQMFTHGDLENLALPPVDTVDDLDARIAALPSDDDVKPPGSRS